MEFYYRQPAWVVLMTQQHQLLRITWDRYHQHFIVLLFWGGNQVMNPAGYYLGVMKTGGVFFYGVRCVLLKLAGMTFSLS